METSGREMSPALATCEEYQKMLRGELYYSFGPEMTAARRRSALACKRFNAAEDVTRREQVQLFRDILGDKTPLPPPMPTPEEDEALFADDPMVDTPIKMDYGIHVTIGSKTYIGFNFTILDSCRVTIGARTLIGPNVSLYSATHPLDAAVRNGVDGPEAGKEIHIGEDCWVGGSVIFCPGVRIGRGCVVGAGSVVTKSVEPFTLVGGSPARIIRKLEHSAPETLEHLTNGVK